jgi:hypothetical protein
MVLFPSVLRCTVHTGVNQMQRFLVSFLFFSCETNVRSRLLYKGTAPRFHAILVATKCGTLQHEQIMTLCGTGVIPVKQLWQLNRNFANCWVSAKEDVRCRPSVHQTSSSMTLTETSTKTCERTHVYRWSSLCCHSACRKSDDTV